MSASGYGGRPRYVPRPGATWWQRFITFFSPRRRAEQRTRAVLEEVFKQPVVDVYTTPPHLAPTSRREEREFNERTMARQKFEIESLKVDVIRAEQEAARLRHRIDELTTYTTTLENEVRDLKRRLR